jgi:uncharacterized protein YecE (DUF72 family)
MTSQFYIGPAGWTYKDWEDIVYPSQAGKKFDALAYMAQLVNLIEINSSFYRPPAPMTVRSWVSRVSRNPDFKFTYKLWQAYTHEQGKSPSEGEEEFVKEGLRILKEHDRLGALLIQFPWSFKSSPDSYRRIEQLIGKFHDYHPVIEIRHSSWNNEDFFNFLKQQGSGFANIDQPIIGSSIGLTSHVLEQTAYLRLHGRNYQQWFAKDTDVAMRYNYLYNNQEMLNIKSVIEKMMDDHPKIYIIFNNHYRGQAVVNAFEMMFLITQKKIKAPDSLLNAYPQLTEIAEPVSIT